MVPRIETLLTFLVAIITNILILVVLIMLELAKQQTPYRQTLGEKGRIT